MFSSFYGIYAFFFGIIFGRLIAQKKKRKKTSGSEKVRTKQKRSDEAGEKQKMTSNKDV